jgi:ACT domain
MLLRLRMSVPDRPGSLARVTAALGEAGADVQQVSVLAREAGRAWDDFTLVCPDRLGVDGLVRLLDALPGVVVEGAWPTLDGPGYLPELDIVRHALAAPHRALQSLVDALPGLVSASWAAARLETSGEEVLLRSVDAPVEVPDLRPVRPLARTLRSEHVATVPLGAALVTVGSGGDSGSVTVARRTGAPFHRLELDRVDRLVDVVSSIVATGLRRRAAAPAPAAEG